MSGEKTYHWYCMTSQGLFRFLHRYEPWKSHGDENRVFWYTRSCNRCGKTQTASKLRRWQA